MFGQGLSSVLQKKRKMVWLNEEGAKSALELRKTQGFRVNAVSLKGRE